LSGEADLFSLTSPAGSAGALFCWWREEAAMATALRGYSYETGYKPRA